MKRIKNIIFVLAFAALAAGCAGEAQKEDGLLLSETKTGIGSESDHEAKDAGKAEADSREGSGFPEETAGKAEESLIYVQVSGAVEHPGVYALPEGSRVFQAVELAGGMTEEAEEKSLNQAEKLTDGQMLSVLTREEAAAQPLSQPEESAEDDGKVNLNTATAEELMTLPGIGEAKAQSILSWREEHGSFARIEDLMKIEGIKEGVFSKIEDYVKVQ